MANSKNTRLAINLGMIVLGMVMLAYASVPLYRLFCQVTGYGGTTQQAKPLPDHALDRTITITFNADIDSTLHWKFAPGETKHVTRIGEQSLTYYVAENLTDQPLKGHATYNVVPFEAGAYFNKIECFCFTEQTLGPRQKVHMPISFFIDPEIVNDPDIKNIETITLSYTFFSAKNEGSK